MSGKDEDKSMLNDERMRNLFVLFDQDSDQSIGFKEVAIGLFQLTKDLEDAKKNAASLLLMMDKDEQRVLTYEQFAKLIMGTAATMEMTFDELAEKLAFALKNPSEISDEVMAELVVAEEAYEQAEAKKSDEKERKMTLSALSYSRTGKVFELWDTNHDGNIDFSELMAGLRRYQKAAHVGIDVQADAVKIMGYDKDSNQTLDKEEFAYAVASYAKAVDRDLHEMIDFMCVVSNETSSTTLYEEDFKATNMFAPSKFTQSLGTILDFGAEGEDSEAEDEW